MERPVTDAPRLNLLIIDDNPLDRSLAGAYAEAFGWSTIMVADGHAGLACARAEIFDVIVLDFHLPDMTGLNVLERLRGTEGPNQTTPALLWTASRLAPIMGMLTPGSGIAAVGKPISLETFQRYVIRLQERGPVDASSVYRAAD